MNWRDKDGKKIKRNAPCPCGSGKKFKKCCFLKIKHPLYKNCSCGSGKEFRKCCYIVERHTGTCRHCGVAGAVLIVRGDGSSVFRCKNKICLYKQDTRDMEKSKLEIREARK